MLSLPVAHGPLGLGEFDSPIPHARISALSLEHDDLGAAMEALTGADLQDELMIARLKKRRLQLREEIAGLVSTKMPAKSVAADFLGDADNDADIDASAPDAVRMAPSNAAGSFVVSIFAAVLILFVMVLGWSDMVDSLNQTLAQIYLLSLLVAANG
ncbi:MAG TPA: YdcH family protein [Rhizomicrobium sp.]|jgi:hypothetical protein|nr:YdcH family protein [Rhizomicrobium sp.]